MSLSLSTIQSYKTITLNETLQGVDCDQSKLPLRLLNIRRADKNTRMSLYTYKRGLGRPSLSPVEYDRMILLGDVTSTACCVVFLRTSDITKQMLNDVNFRVGDLIILIEPRFIQQYLDENKATPVIRERQFAAVLASRQCLAMLLSATWISLGENEEMKSNYISMDSAIRATAWQSFDVQEIKQCCSAVLQKIRQWSVSGWVKSSIEGEDFSVAQAKNFHIIELVPTYTSTEDYEVAQALRYQPKNLPPVQGQVIGRSTVVHEDAEADEDIENNESNYENEEEEDRQRSTRNSYSRMGIVMAI
ncbi:hypothetical protein FOL47_000296 [Perkinsus chesapeaki]|uniref:Uncharacterized protein n=1 Tax=Perkinsus chesapeaki TaxID=330153 RepID=A0A7J6KXE7_PERCH|nr:hypothetical protein FOL47_000296 [Perkinsus chesapeaki]